MSFLLTTVFAALAAQSPSDQVIYDAIRAPQVTGIPPSIALRNMCVLDDGEIRHYGQAVIATADGEEIAHAWLDKWLEGRIPPAGVSYLHLITLAEEEDTKGSYFRSFSVK